MNIMEMKGVEELVESSRKQNHWTGSVNEEFSTKSPKTKGHIGEEAVKSVLKDLGCNVEKSPTTHFDALVDGKKVEIKTSSLWKGGNLKYQEIRLYQDYDIIVFVSVLPETVKFHWCYKKDLEPFLKQQHGEGNMMFEFNYTKSSFPSVMKTLEEGNIW